MEDFIEICKRKQEGENISWAEIAKLFNISSPEAARSKWKRIRKKINYNKIDIPNKKIFNQIQIEKQKLKQEKNEIKKFVRQYAQFDNVLELIQESIRNLPLLDLPKYTNDLYCPIDKELVMVISDLHIGQYSDLEINPYNFDILTKRLFKYFDEVTSLSYVNDIKKINIFLCGDLIEGHDIFKSSLAYQDIDPINQVLKTSEILSRLINELTKDFLVDIYYVIGNHGRLSYNVRSTTNFEKLIVKFIENRLYDNKNLKIHKSNGIYTIADILGHKFLLFHGDVLKDKVNAPLRLKELLTEDIEDIIIGHYHHIFENELSGNTSILTCGSFVGTNEYSFKKLQVSSSPSQTCFFVTKERGRWGTYKIKLN